LAVLVTGTAAVVFLNSFRPEKEELPPKGKEVVQLPEQKATPPQKLPDEPPPSPPVVEKKSQATEPKVEKQNSPAAAEKKDPPVETVKKAAKEKKNPAVDAKKAPVKEIKKSTVPAELQKKIDEAIARGVAFLQSPQARDKSWCAKSHPVGFTSLLALTLLECGVPKDDFIIRAAAGDVRSQVPSNNFTYDVALALLFLDKLADEGDEKLIRLLAIRLVAAQDAAGGWTYPCPTLDAAAGQELIEFLQADHAARVTKKKKGNALTIPERLRRLAIFQGSGGVQPGARFSQNSDNSNTQFALLALWAARRHGVPLGRTFALAEQRFRTTQLADGGWPYRPFPNVRSTPSMTCVGLLGLAIGRGSEFELLHASKTGPGESVNKLANQDEGIVRGLKRLGQAVGTPTGRTTGVPLVNLYFLWSVERVAVLYNLPTIGDKDWYRWGVEVLLSNQQADGRWWEPNNSLTEPAVDTCFALLFLNRSDLVPDLGRNLRLFVPIVDPDRKSSTPQ
jgi:hypothetical protein